MDEQPNVNNLNGVPNFGHGLPQDGVVEAGVSDVGIDETLVEAPIETPAEPPVEEQTN